MRKKKHIQSNIFQLKQDLLSSLKDRSSLARKIHAIKNSDDYSNITKVSRDLCKISPSFEHLIYGYLFPASYSQLGVCNPHIIQSESLSNEIRWTIHQIQKHKNAIQTFSMVRATVEKYVLLGSYEEALKEILSFHFPIIGYLRYLI